jgi:hypothetical protein
MEKPLIGRSEAFLQMSVLGKFDRSTFELDRSTFQDFRIFKHFHMKFVIPLLLTYKTQKTNKNIIK